MEQSGGLYNLSTFLTAAGLVTAVTLLWTQFWYSHAEEAKKLRVAGERRRESWEALFGLAWAEGAALILLMSFGWAIVSSLYIGDRTSPVAVGMFIAGLVMTVMGVAESLHGVLYKSRRGESIDSALVDRGLMKPGFKGIVWQLYALLWIGAIMYFAIWGVNGPEQSARPYHEVLRLAVPVMVGVAAPLVILVAPLVYMNPKGCWKTLLLIYYAVVWIAAAVCASQWVVNRTGESPLTWPEMIHSLPAVTWVLLALLALPILFAVFFPRPKPLTPGRPEPWQSCL